MNLILPPSYQKKKKPVPYRCDTCGDRECRRRWQIICWIHCGKWKPEVLSLDALPENIVR